MQPHFLSWISPSLIFLNSHPLLRREKKSSLHCDLLSAHGAAFRSLISPTLPFKIIIVLVTVNSLEWVRNFQAINHGIDGAFLDDLHQVTKQFFALPMEEKKKYLRKDDDLDGYGNDTVLSEHQTLDWSDRLYLTVYPPEIRKLHFWPESPPKFR